MYLGLVAAAAFGLARVRQLFAAAPAPVGALAVLVPFCLALYEYRPRALVTRAATLTAAGWASRADARPIR